MTGMVRIVWRVLGVVAILIVLFVAADALLWQHRVGAGTGFESVQVSRVSIATLKGTKEEYYSDGSEMVQCSRSALPMPASDGWFSPCWWLRKHRNIEVRY